MDDTIDQGQSEIVERIPVDKPAKMGKEDGFKNKGGFGRSLKGQSTPKPGKDMGGPFHEPELTDGEKIPPIKKTEEKASSQDADSKPDAKPADAPKVDEIVKQTFKFLSKVNGKEEQVELDEDTIKRDYQKWKAADQMFQDAAAMRKQNDALLKKGRTVDGVMELLKAFGHDPDKLAEAHLADRLSFELLSPEQKEIRRLQMENQRLAREQAEKRQAQEMGMENELIERHRTELQGKIIEAMKDSNLPNSPETVRKMARQMKLHAERGVFLEPKEVIGLVRREIEQENKAILNKLTPEQMLEFIGKDKLDEFRKWELSKVKNILPEPKEKREVREPQPRQQNRHFKSMREFEKKMMAIKNSGK